LKCLQCPSQLNAGNLSNVVCGAIRNFGSKKREDLKGKINKL
jgi:hypothetical protein